MGKRITVKFVGNDSPTERMATIPVGTEFKATMSNIPNANAVWIRGSNLTKAAGRGQKFQCKKYLFLLGLQSSQMVVA